MDNAGGNCTGYEPIADYAAIGDCHTAALVSSHGSIDWYCPDRFDSPAVFLSILDSKRRGRLSVAPAGNFSADRCYAGDSNILETTFRTDSGKVRITDFMPVYRRLEHYTGYDVGTSRRLLRLVEGLSGEVDVRVDFKPEFGYASQRVAEVSLSNAGAIISGDGTHLSFASSGIQLHAGGDGGINGEVTVREGDRKWLALTTSHNPKQAREALSANGYDDQLRLTREYWKSWASRCTYQGPYRNEVIRSALTLKLLTYEPTGAIVAAPTTSLPELVGGGRNWDYRYTWLRDSSLILYALMTVGYREEAADFFNWLEQVQKADPTAAPQIMYTIDGKRNLPERTLDYLDGYMCSRPVRIGNEAAQQFQLDIYGEVLTSAYLAYRPGPKYHTVRHAPSITGAELSGETWQLLHGLVERAISEWIEPDNGIWEVRAGRQHYLYSKLMCWAAVDRGIRFAREWPVPAPLERWRKSRDSIKRAILGSGYNRELQAFTQVLGGKVLDASALVIPRIGFLPATDPRVQSTIDRIKQELTANGLVYRYRSGDGLPGGEATFALCTFWLVDALALSGRLDEAHSLFEQTVKYANDVGLMSEEIDPDHGLLLGNFPQGFAHLAIIGSAVNLAKVAKHGAEKRSETEAGRAPKAQLASAKGYSARTYGKEEMSA